MAMIDLPPCGCDCNGTDAWVMDYANNGDQAMPDQGVLATPPWQPDANNYPSPPQTPPLELGLRSADFSTGQAFASPPSHIEPLPLIGQITLTQEEDLSFLDQVNDKKGDAHASLLQRRDARYHTAIEIAIEQIQEVGSSTDALVIVPAVLALLRHPSNSWAARIAALRRVRKAVCSVYKKAHLLHPVSDSANASQVRKLFIALTRKGIMTSRDIAYAAEILYETRFRKGHMFALHQLLDTAAKQLKCGRHLIDLLTNMHRELRKDKGRSRHDEFKVMVGVVIGDIRTCLNNQKLSERAAAVAARRARIRQRLYGVA